MTPLAKAMEVVFIAAWCVGIGAHIYASRYYFPMWKAGFKKREDHEGYRRKAITGYVIFALAVGVGFAAGGIADRWGGGWH